MEIHKLNYAEAKRLLILHFKSEDVISKTMNCRKYFIRPCHASF